VALIVAMLPNGNLTRGFLVRTTRAPV